MNTPLQFPDRLVSYDAFLEDLANRVVFKMQQAQRDPKYLSQRQAYAVFGRGNVDRWRREGKVKPCKRPGKVEYCTADLRILQSKQQDYFKNLINMRKQQTISKETFAKHVHEAVSDWYENCKNPNEVLGVLADAPDHCAIGRIDRGSQKDERVKVEEIEFTDLILPTGEVNEEAIANLYDRFFPGK